MPVLPANTIIRGSVETKKNCVLSLSIVVERRGNIRCVWDRSKYGSEIPHNYIVERYCQGKLIRKQLGDVYRQNQFGVR